ncbi:YncE family protein [Pelovirga terrestris]|uniref:YncE family protein n=1 Tax=Pelovirga terrestris TaxID=2771352 RepID=A0A8J6QNQ4_9BACT|nr:YncE family protein [Pelovirga terrestris]MBD1401092.1 YncE family protein [Pelovirga terrestris]
MLSGSVFSPQDLPRTSVFLALRHEFSPQIRVDLSDLEILADGVWLPLLNEPVLLDAQQIAGGQVHLGGSSLPAGRYSLLRLQIDQIWTPDGVGAWQPRLNQQMEIEIPLTAALMLDHNDSKSLFVTWDAAATLALKTDAGDFSAAPAQGELPVDVLYVSCPDINTVFVVRTDNNRVIDSFGIAGGPTRLALDGDRLYVLASRQRELLMIELSSYRVIDRFPFPLNDEPGVMVLDRLGRTAYLLDHRSGYLSRVDLVSGSLVARVSLGYQPADLIYLEEQNLLAVSLGLAQRVLLLDPTSLRVQGTLSTGAGPAGLAMLEQRLYVAEQGSSAVAVFDLQRRAPLERLLVGIEPTQIIATDHQLYVAHPADGTLAVLVPGQLSIAREIRELGTPAEMAYGPRYRQLYVLDALRGGVTVIDTNADLLSTRIPLGAIPADLVVTP